MLVINCLGLDVLTRTRPRQYLRDQDQNKTKAVTLKTKTKIKTVTLKTKTKTKTVKLKTLKNCLETVSRRDSVSRLNITELIPDETQRRSL